MTEIDAREFRNALGSFATGVTVITTMAAPKTPGEPGTPVAMTANSFASVSLDPPLILWSIGRDAQCFDDFERAEYFAVHILHHGQQPLSQLCASRDVDKFAEVNWRLGETGAAPIFDDYNACLECKVENRYNGGDHVIIVGRVCALDNRQRATHETPLLFYRGSYRGIS